MLDPQQGGRSKLNWICGGRETAGMCCFEHKAPTMPKHSGRSLGFNFGCSEISVVGKSCASFKVSNQRNKGEEEWRMGRVANS